MTAAVAARPDGDVDTIWEECRQRGVVLTHGFIKTVMDELTNNA